MAYDDEPSLHLQRPGQIPGIFTKLLCPHAEWRRNSSGYDSTVQCLRCGKVKAEASGDIAPW